MAKTSKAKAPRAKKSVASASPRLVRRRKRGPMNDALVTRYASDLKAMLGTNAFEEIFERLKGDRDIQQDEAVAIASLLLESKIAASTARGAALGRIAKLHSSLLTFKLKQRAVGGRSAA